MSRRPIQFHPDSTDSEEQSFVLIGINLFFGLAALLLVAIMLGQRTYGILEISGVILCIVIPISTSYIVLKGNKTSMAYDRASQIVNYSDPIQLNFVSQKQMTIPLLVSSENKFVNQELFVVTLEKNSQQFICVIREKVPDDLLNKSEKDLVLESFVDQNSKNVAAFLLEEKMYWGIPKELLKLTAD